MLPTSPPERRAPLPYWPETRFATATHAAPLLRGQSGQPVYITAAGLPLADAVSIVRAMQGPFRLPDAVRRADALARAGPELR